MNALRFSPLKCLISHALNFSLRKKSSKKVPSNKNVFKHIEVIVSNIQTKNIIKGTAFFLK